jgi:O-antigen/teichoic acid export membrane protein
MRPGSDIRVPDDGPPGAAAGLRVAWRLSVGGAAVVAAALILLGPAALGLLYGPSFGPAGGALALLALSLIPSMAATHRSLELVATGRETQMLWAQGASLVVLVALLVVLLPIGGWPGAAWAILAAETFQASVLLALRLRSVVSHRQVANELAGRRAGWA